MQYPGGSCRLFCTKLGLLDPLGLPGNSIRTAKYTVLSFLPVNLFQQFTRVANMYFLFIAFLQLIPGLSPTSWVTTVGPLCFVLFINGIKVSGACTPYCHTHAKHLESVKLCCLPWYVCVTIIVTANLEVSSSCHNDCHTNIPSAHMLAPAIQALTCADNTHHRIVPCTHTHTVLHFIMPAVNADDTSAYS